MLLSHSLFLRRQERKPECFPHPKSAFDPRRIANQVESFCCPYGISCCKSLLRGKKRSIVPDIGQGIICHLFDFKKFIEPCRIMNKSQDHFRPLGIISFHKNCLCRCKRVIVNGVVYCLLYPRKSFDPRRNVNEAQIPFRHPQISFHQSLSRGCKVGIVDSIVYRLPYLQKILRFARDYE